MRTAQLEIAKPRTAKVETPVRARSRVGSRSPDEILVERIHIEAREIRRKLVRLHGPNKAGSWYGGVLEVLAHFEIYGRLPKRDVMYEFEEIGWKWARKEILKSIH